MNSSSSNQKRSKLQRVHISIWAEYFLMRLFGHPMAHIHGIRNMKTWKRILAKLAGSIEKAIKVNVNSDGLHTLRLKKFSEQFSRACKERNINQPDIVLPLIGIIFELLGGTPRYSERPRINRKDDYALFRLRELDYRQTAYQKAQTILEASREKPFSDSHHHDDLFDVYAFKFSFKSDEFIQWYKLKYPEVYLQLF